MKQRFSYKHLKAIDGSHPLRAAVADGYIDYGARRRRGGSVFYFNFQLAKEMGLLPTRHPDQLNDALQRALLDVFSIQIINEYDLQHGLTVPARDRLPGRYMATRYLQIQHPGKRGTTSGDGRAIWNGYFKGRRGIWDISSCGTGTTALSPGVVNEGRFIKTGDENVSYGNGRADLSDGVCAAMMSEIYHNSGITTERTLLIIAFPDGTAINVRATPNLLRPAHFFRYIKQGNLPALEGLMEYYIDRQVQNGLWPRLKDRNARYLYFLDSFCHDFARMAARFESEYIFCWLDWDGDNILMDGGIIDYGSLRQFGLFHHEYRYDDVDRMSTTITEQKNKARYIVQTFVQIVDALIKGRKKNIRQYATHKTLRDFDKLFAQARNEAFLYRMGVEPALIERLSDSSAVTRSIKQLRGPYDYFERAKSSRGIYPVSDGISCDAIYCMRDCMREMPRLLLDAQCPVSAQSFIEMMRSRYASDEDVSITPYRMHRIKEFQFDYQNLVKVISKITDVPRKQLLTSMMRRSALINRYDRITGDAIIHVAEQLIEASGTMKKHQILQMFNDFVDAQVLSPEYQARSRRRYCRTTAEKSRLNLRSNTSGLYQQMMQIVAELREGI